MSILCKFGFHRWIEWGAARHAELFRRCERCERREQGVENGRAIAWISTDAANDEAAPGAADPCAAAHPDDLAVDAFAAAMKAKLAEARAKGRRGWDDKIACSQHRLSQMLRDHVDKGDPRDVANFACFLWSRGEGILPAPKEAQPRRAAQG